MSDLNLIYEQYRKVVNEAMPFAAPDEGFGQPGHITRHKPQMGGRPTPSGYKLGKYAQERNLNVVDVTRDIVNRIKSDVFVREPHTVGGMEFQYYFDGSMQELRARVSRIILNALGGGNAEADHTARIIINHILKLADVEQGRIVTSELPEVGEEPAVQQAVQRAVARAPRAPREVAPVEPEEVAMQTIQLTSSYKLAEGRIRNPDVRDQYMFLVRDVGLNQEMTGHELVSKLRANGSSYTASKSYLSDMIAAGTLEKVESPDADAPHDPGPEVEYDPDEVLQVLRDLQRNAAGGRRELPEVGE